MFIAFSEPFAGSGWRAVCDVRVRFRKFHVIAIILFAHQI